MHTTANAATSADPLYRARLLLNQDTGAPTLRELAAAVGLSPTHLQRAFRRRFGISPAEYARTRRFTKLKAELREGASVTDAVYAAGFGSPSRVYEHSDRLLGMPPAHYRAGGPHTAIRYTIAASPLGPVLVAATARGICRVSLGDAEAQLTAALRSEFPRATLTRVDAGRDEWLTAVLARIAAELTNGTPEMQPPLPPLDITATAFQWRVWQALTHIPAGETRSYRQIARAIGEPGAARAVGRACGSNRLAFIVPCHRVVRADGTSGGWRWGVARKQALLERERQTNGQR